MRRKITVVGAGMVGGTTAQRLAERDYADVVLVDIVEGLPQGKALDILEAAPIRGYDGAVIGTNSYEETADSDIVVVTSGLPRKPGMSRDDLVLKNQQIIQSVIQSVVLHSPGCFLLMVANPLDAMAQLALHVSGFPRERICGMAGVLDTARFRTFLAHAMGVSVRDVQAYVLGGHGDTMVPLIKYTTVGGVPIENLLPKEEIDRLVERTRKGGEEIVNLLKTGSAFYAPSAAIVEMVDAIVLDRKRILPCSVYLTGEYGIDGLFVGVPAKLGAGGVEEIVELELTAEERMALQRSADAVRELVEIMKI